MVLQRFTDLVLRSHLHAMGMAFMLSFIPFVGATISILIAAFVTLRKGAYEGTVVMCAAMAPYLLSYLISPAQGKGLEIAVVAITTINILTWLLAVVLRRYGSWRLVIEVSMVIGVMLIGAIHVFFPEVKACWAAQLTNYLNKTAAIMQQFTTNNVPVTQKMPADMIASRVKYVSGFIAASLIFNALFQLMVARWWQAKIFNPGGLSKELSQVRLSYLAAAIFIFGLLLAYTKNAFGLDIIPMVTLGFCLAGLSLLHNLLLGNKASWFWLAIIYLMVIFIYPVGVISVVLIGLIDSLFNVRPRLRKVCSIV